MAAMNDHLIIQEVPAAGDAPLTTLERDLLRETIRRTLADHAGDAPDARAVAAATLNVWQQVAARLTPVLGARGVDVIFRRSLHLTHSAFPWLAIAGGEDEGNDAFLASLKVRLASRETEETVAASYTLLVTFTELLTTLTGESLTERLLRPVWAPASPTAKQETRS